MTVVSNRLHYVLSFPVRTHFGSRRSRKRLSSPEKRLTAPAKCAILPSALMLVWLSWQSSSLVMSRSPVRIRPQAPKKQHPIGCCFFIELVRSRSLSPPRGGNPATSSKKATPERVLFFLLRLSGVEVYPPSRGKSGHKLPKATPERVLLSCLKRQIDALCTKRLLAIIIAGICTIIMVEYR